MPNPGKSCAARVACAAAVLTAATVLTVVAVPLLGAGADAAPPAATRAPVTRPAVPTAPRPAAATRPAIRPATGPAAAGAVTARETLLYSIPDKTRALDTIAALDARHVGCIEERGGRPAAVAVNGKRTKDHEWVVLRTLSFSSDGSRFTYKTLHDGLMFVAVGPSDDPAAAVEGKGYFLSGPVLFSPDGKRTAYQALRKKGDKPVMVVDGNEVGPYDSIEDRLTTFSADGKRLAFHVRVGDKEAFVIDGTQSKLYDKALGATFSSDGARVGYRVLDVDQKFMVVDGREGPRYDMVAGLTFGGGGRKVAYAAGKATKQMLVVDDGPPGKPNLRAFKAYDGLGDIAFSPDGRRLGITVQTPAGGTTRPADPGNAGDAGAAGPRPGVQWQAVIDGKEGPAYDGISQLLFSADNRHVAYVAGRQGRQVLVVDGVEGPLLDGVGVFVFSPDGSRFAYAAQQGQERWVMVDHKPFAPAGLFAFSPDGRHVCHAVSHGEKWALAIDNVTAGGDYDGFPLGGRIVFDSPDAARVIVGRGLQLIRLDLKAGQ